MFWMSFLMKKKQHKTSFDHLLQTHHPFLQHIMTKLDELQTLNHRVMSFLDKKYHEHCQVCNLRDGILVLGVDAPTWGTLLRFECPTLLSHLRKIPSLAGIIKIDIKVLPPEPMEENIPPRRMKKLSPQAINFYKNLAHTCEDPSLQKILFRIASHGEDAAF